MPEKFKETLTSVLVENSSVATMLVLPEASLIAGFITDKVTEGGDVIPLPIIPKLSSFSSHPKIINVIIKNL